MTVRLTMEEMAYRSPALLPLALLAGTVLMLGAFDARAQPEAIRCLPPEAPMTALPESVLAEYRAEIASEFEAYFGAFSDYIACLDEERTRALAEARVATEAYSTLLDTIPAAKDFP